MKDHEQGRLVAYGLILRGHPDDSSEDQIGSASLLASESRRLAACWNAFVGIPTEAIEEALSHEYAGEDAIRKNIIRLLGG